MLLIRHFAPISPIGLWQFAGGTQPVPAFPATLNALTAPGKSDRMYGYAKMD
jgi:hypothetical protein